MSWKQEYVKWYKLAEEILAGAIPQLEAEKIPTYVSKNNWLIIPTARETDRAESTQRSDPNLYFELREGGKIEVGLFYNTLESVQRLKNLLHGIHTDEKERFLQELRKLDDSFKTSIERKLKEHHFQQTPTYLPEWEFRTNSIDDNLLTKAFSVVDQILEESDALQKRDRKSWRVVAPVINIARTIIDQEDVAFRTVFTQLKPIYSLALRIRTAAEITNELHKETERKRTKRQQMFREFIEDLKQRGIRGQEYRAAVERWNKEHPWTEPE